MKEEKILEIQNNINNKLALKLKDIGIDRIVLTSLGNSIGSGYSMVRTLTPLLLRNSNLLDTLKKHEINFDIHHFARAQNNSDEHIFDWLLSNVKESEFNQTVRRDYSGGATSMAAPGLDKTKIDEYYPIEKEKDQGLRDIVLEFDKKLANIVVYNGCTGSFLDNVTRGGKITQKLTYGVKRDIKGLEATLKYIQQSNRANKTNTQVYICGAPNWLGIHLTDILNHKLKKVAKEYANTTYVDSVTAKMIYKKLNAERVTDANEAQAILSKIPFPAVDMHYDEIEYLKFNNNIIESINDNYLIKQALINIDRELYAFSGFIEKQSKIEFRESDYINKFLSSIISKQYKLFEDPEERNKFNKIAVNYLMERYPYDFYYLGKENIQKTAEEEIRKFH